VDVINHNLLATAGYVLAEMVEVSGGAPGGDDVGADADELGVDAGTATMIARVMRDQEHALRRLAESLPTGVALVNAQGIIVYANERLHGLLDSPGAAPIDELFARVVAHDKPTLADAVEGAVLRGSDTDLERRAQLDSLTGCRNRFNGGLPHRRSRERSPHQGDIH